MSGQTGHSGSNVPSQGSSRGVRPKKRPTLTFVDPSDLTDLQTVKRIPPKSEPQISLYQRLHDRQGKSKRERVVIDVVAEITTPRPRKKQKLQKPRRGRPRKRPIDPSRPWIESDDDDDDYEPPVEDDSDEEAFIRHLEEEKAREEEEELRRKMELQRQRRLKREERRSRATGRPGRPRLQTNFAHLYANVVDDHQSVKPSEHSDGEQSLINSVPEDEETPDLAPHHPPSTVSDIAEEPENGTFDPAPTGSDLPRLSAVISRRKAPPLLLPASAHDLACPPEHLLDAVSIYQTLRRYGRLLRLSPFQLEDFLSALLANENSSILASVHIALLNALMTEDEANGTNLCPPDCKDAVSLILGHVLDRYTWPYILALYLSGVKRGEQPALAALARVGNATALISTGPTTAVSFSGGADAVVTSDLFHIPGSDQSVIPLDPSYPFVDLPQRLAVLRGLIGLFLATGPVRADVLHEGFMPHDDYCRVCRQSGEVLCCDTCPAVFHLACLTPPLEAVPNTSWHCPLCEVEQSVYGGKKIPKMRGETRVSNLGYDRAGRVYWHMEGRLFVEPVDFSQVEPELPGLTEGVRDLNWEKLEVDDPTDDVFEDEEPEEILKAEDTITEEGADGDTKKEDETPMEESTKTIEADPTEPTDPSVVYSNEPPVYYYSTLEQITAVRQRLSTKWEPTLCTHLDAVIAQMESRASSKPDSKEGIKKEEEQQIAAPLGGKWPSILPLPPALTTSQLTALFSNSQTGETVDASEETPSPMESVFVLELSGGVLVHNQDGLFENFPLPPEEHVQRLTESRPAFVHPAVTQATLPAPSKRWRGWVNTLGRGLFVPNPTSSSSSSASNNDTEANGGNGGGGGGAPTDLVNIALNRPQMHDEREKRRALANKFCLTEAAMAAWRWLDAEAALDMIRRATKATAPSKAAGKKEPDDVTSRRADSVGPLRWLHTMKLTLCFLETQLPAAVLSPAWRLLRRDWLAAVLKATSVGELADLLGRLEAAIRSIAFLRIWTASIGPLQLDRFTAAQREEEKRNRVLERVSAAVNAASNTLIKTKTVQPVRHTIWKTRGEEYRRLGGDGWQWVSATRREQQIDTLNPPLRSSTAVERPPHLGLGWGVLPELLTNTELHPPLPEGTTTGHGVHPITGVPLCRNVARHVYTIPQDQLQNNPNARDGVINISKCLSEGGGGFYPSPARCPTKTDENAGKGSSSQRRRSAFRLDSLLSVRKAAAERDEAAAEAAETSLAGLRVTREVVQSRVAEILSRLAELNAAAQSARSEHAKAVKARLAAIEEGKRASDQRMRQHQMGAGGGGLLRQTSVTPSARRRSVAPGGGASRRRTPAQSAASRRSVQPRVGEDGANEDSAGTDASSNAASSNTGSNALRRSSRRQKTKSVDPDFVVDFGEEEEEEGDDEVEGDQLYEGGTIDPENVVDLDAQAEFAHQRRLPQFDGTGDDDDDEVDVGNESDGLAEADHQKNKADAAPTAFVASASSTQQPTSQGSGKSILAMVMEGAVPVKKPASQNGPESSTTLASQLQVGVRPANVTLLPTTISTNPSGAGGQPVRVVRVIRPPGGSQGTPQILQTTLTKPPAATSGAGPGTVRIQTPAESALQRSLIQLSSNSGVIVTQASTLPAGYRLISPTSTAATSLVSSVRAPVSIVQVRPGQPISILPTVTATTPTLRGGVVNSQMRPLLAPAAATTPIAMNRPLVGISPAFVPNLRPRMVRMVSQPMQLDPRLDQDVTEAAKKLYDIDTEIYNLRKELRDLETQLSHLDASIEEREALVLRSSACTASRYSLNTLPRSLWARLNRAAKAVTTSLQKQQQQQQQQRGSKQQRSQVGPSRAFLALPKRLPEVNPYAWPPDCLALCQVDSKYPQSTTTKGDPVPSLFRLSRSNLRSLILAAGRKEVPGYEAEKKRLNSIPWTYPTARPCFAEAWRYRLRQVLHLPTSECGNLNSASHFGVSMANVATHLRLLWHCLRWDDIVLRPGLCEDAVLLSNDEYFLKQPLPDGGHCLKRVTGIQPLDKFWLRAKFLLETVTNHKPPPPPPAPRRREVAANSTPTPPASAAPRRGRRPGKRRFADPDYDPAADEGWRIGIPCSKSALARESRNARRANANQEALSDNEESDDSNADDMDAAAAEEVSSSRTATKPPDVSHAWVTEDSLQLWQIRDFLDRLLPVDSAYPPPMPSEALKVLPASLAQEATAVASDDSSSWIVPSTLSSKDPNRSASPKPPSPPAPLTPPPSVMVVMETQGNPATPGGLSVVTPGSQQQQQALRPLIVNSASKPVISNGGSSTKTPGGSAKRPGAPLSPNTEAAKARARSLAASHAARISAANRRFRNEKAALEQRVTALVEEMANRRRMFIKHLALQVQDEILASKKKKAAAAVAQHKSEEDAAREMLPATSPLPEDSVQVSQARKRSKNTPASTRGRKKAGARQQPPPSSSPPSSKVAGKRGQTKCSSTSSTDPLTDSDETPPAAREPKSPVSAVFKTPRRKRKSSEKPEKVKEEGEDAIAPGPVAMETPKPTRGRGRGRVTAGGGSRRPFSSDGEDEALEAEVPESKRSRAKSVKKESSPPVATPLSSRSRGRGRGRPASVVEPTVGRTPRLPKFLQEEMDAEKAKTEKKSSGGKLSKRRRIDDPGESENKASEAAAATAAGSKKVYCICKKPYDQTQAYIGCDLCQDWFHFSCVGLESGSANLGDSWVCPDCQRAEASAKDQLYCLCRTPYDYSRVYIACDSCDEWYHAECVGMSPEAAAGYEGSYTCPMCLKKAQEKKEEKVTPEGDSVKLEQRKKKKKRSRRREPKLAVVEEKPQQEEEEKRDLKPESGGGGEEQSKKSTIYEAPLTESVKKAVLDLIDEMQSHKLSWPLMKPPGEADNLSQSAFPTEGPRDLMTFRAELEEGLYRSLGDVSFAGNRLFSHARGSFSAVSKEFHCLEVLETLFLRRMKEVRGLL